MNNKKGISLIVLVITILVMIILAGVVIVSLQNDNPINKAKMAKVVDSIQSVRGALSQYAVTAQANSTDNETFGFDYLLSQDKAKPETAGTFTTEKVGYLITSSTYKVTSSVSTLNEKTVKDLLGVDPTTLSTYGVFEVDRKTGSSEFLINESGAKALGLKQGADTTLPTGIKLDAGVNEKLDAK